MMPVIKQILKALSVLLAFHILACEAPLVPDEIPSDTPSKSPSPSEGPSSVPQVDVQILVQDALNQTIPAAQVTLSSSNMPPQMGQTAADGRVHFAGLRQDTTYTLSVEAPGYASASRQANLSQLATLGQRELILGIILQPIRSSVSGQILDPSGQPVVGAAIFDTRQTVLSDAEGRFTLSYLQAADLQLSIGKTGYMRLEQPLSVALNQPRDLGTLTLQRQLQPLRAMLDTSHQPLGRQAEEALADYQGLQQLLSQQGYQLISSADLLNALQQLDVLILLSPSQPFSVEESSAIQAFVRQGGKLILSAEWAGFNGFLSSAANQLLQPFQLRFGMDTLRQGGHGFVTISQFINHPITQGLNQIQIYQAGSVEVLNSDPLAQILARSPEDSFRILNNSGAFGVVAATAYGTGKVIAISDTSLWSDTDSDGSGSSNLNSADNRRLLEQILAW